MLIEIIEIKDINARNAWSIPPQINKIAIYPNAKTIAGNKLILTISLKRILNNIKIFLNILLS